MNEWLWKNERKMHMHMNKLVQQKQQYYCHYSRAYEESFYPVVVVCYVWIFINVSC